MLYSNILQAIGNTPLIQLKSFGKKNMATLYAKAEFLNVGGSIKTRTAYQMILDAKRRGIINNKSVIVEVSSGNQGVGLALVGAVLRLKVIIVMPSSVSEERRKLIMQYGASVVIIEDNGNIGDCIKRCEEYALGLKRENPNVFIPNQFANIINPLTHEEQTAKEIIEDLKGNIDGLCLGIGSGGSITGIGRAIKRVNPKAQIWAVEPKNATVICNNGKNKIGTHIQMGIGDGIIPPVLDKSLISHVVTVSDKQALKMAKELCLKEGILCGISSGSNLVGAIALAKRLGKDKNVVTVLPDTGERYFSTPLFER